MPEPEQTPLEAIIDKAKSMTEQLVQDLFAKTPQLPKHQIPTAPVVYIDKKKILVIRIGALGDIVLCFQAFSDIRKAYPDVEIALLTMPAFVDFAKRMPWFDKVITDPRAAPLDVGKWVQLLKDIRSFGPGRVFDLQCKLRQSVLYGLLGGPLRQEWSGAAPFCSHPRLAHPTPSMHFVDYVAAQLQLANVPLTGAPDVSWFDDDLKGLDLPKRFALLVPGGAPHRQYKRWPSRYYAELAKKLHEEKDVMSIVIGTDQDMDAIAGMRAVYPDFIDYSRQTTIMQVAGLARRAVCVIANDTGPMHIAATVGAPTLGLMSEQVDADWSAPRGAKAKWIQGKPLVDLEIGKVFLELRDFLIQAQ